jgi:prepilin-type N-terminal cleavage/methylation domain-containing protein
MHQAPTHRLCTRSNARGFTLVELLVVLGIIAVLISVVVVVGRGVSQAAKRNTTLNTLQVLDEAMAAYVSSEDASFPRFVEPEPSPSSNANNIWPVFDGVAQQSTVSGVNIPVNTIGLFMYEANKNPRCREILAKIPAKFVRSFDIDGAGPQPALITVFDAWDRPIRLVLPFSDGVITGPKAGTGAAVTAFRPIAEVLVAPTGKAIVSGDLRRNNTTQRDATTCNVLTSADSDGGRCVANKPYFYSVGADGLAGISTPASCGDVDNVGDNVYTTSPNLPKQ